MDFTRLLDTVGLWPALALVLGWWIDKIRREQIRDRDRHIEKLEQEARNTADAQAQEAAEWKQRYFEEAAHRRRT